jgi:DNA-binding XRE family transcriptional regulator
VIHAAVLWAANPKRSVDRNYINYGNTESIEILSIRRGVLIRIRQVKAARALLGWSQADLARRSGISEPTIARLEAGEGELGGREDTAWKIQKAIEGAGIDFIDENGGGPGVRLRKRQREK